MRLAQILFAFFWLCFSLQFSDTAPPGPIPIKSAAIDDRLGALNRILQINQEPLEVTIEFQQKFAITQIQ
jgi:nitrogen fixation-related uncharacterized protein